VSNNIYTPTHHDITPQKLCNMKDMVRHGTRHRVGTSKREGPLDFKNESNAAKTAFFIM
jgi:hypothetical protein